MHIAQSFYKNIISCASLCYCTSPHFVINQGIRQGCPISPLLLVAELKGIEFAEQTFIISQLTDDTCMFLKDKSKIPVILNTLKLFSHASGLSVNQNKREIMTVHYFDILNICGRVGKKKIS